MTRDPYYLDGPVTQCRYDETGLCVRDRLADVVSQGQEPKDRLWAAIAVLALIALLTFVTEFRLPDGTLAVRHVGTRVRR